MNNTMNNTCDISTFPYPHLPGASFLHGTAVPVVNYTTTTPEANSHLATITSLDFCNVTLTYTHPGQNDSINVKIFLPSSSTWNGRFLGTGGGSMATGGFDSAIAIAVSEGYAAAGTDGGHTEDEGMDSSVMSDWAVISPGNVNLYLLQDFASVSLNDMAIVGKAITASYYGKEPDYSYWNGCSQGGRQGMMMAQRYPEAFNGILAGAPAINWSQLMVADYWPPFVMHMLGIYPSVCELDGITAAAIAACDGLDGVIDGIVSAPGLCTFQANETIGRNVTCADESSVYISDGAAKIAQAAWDGPTSDDGSFLWYGLNPSSPLSIPFSIGIAMTTCTSPNTNCTATPFPLSSDWITLFVLKNASFPLENITHKEYTRIFHSSIQEFASIIGTSDTDLSAYKETGGKIISWHGLADHVISSNGTLDYYSKVQERDANVRDFYRFFEAPGVQHCGDGNGPFPEAALGALVSWVEKGIAPNVLAAKSLPGVDGSVVERNLCVWPLVAAYLGGDPMVASSFECRESF
ncbi:feruloyl esterase B precursor [Sclerotinia borealis F-4128]|uniref:Carboxylic ester hydrolase n=1 Tax=Sclerotinia borealis (strain F-4128) TaxID=1432307 RepID=W9CEY8_SCLBF|nr:feruloyl esterase B precursor [Sclerotinia borealis F-4128]